MTSGEVKFNSPLWITLSSCMEWEFLMLEGLGGKVTGIEWLNEYDLVKTLTKSKVKNFR